MARVFVSHASKNAALAAEVHRWLVADGHEAFLDQHLSDGIPAGEEWQQRLHERLRWADAVGCVLASVYLASVWCTAELTIAQTRGSRLLPVRAELGVRHPLLNSVHRPRRRAPVVVHRSVPPEEHLQALTDAGVPEPMAQMAGGVDAGIRAGAFAFTNGDLARLLGRPTPPFVEGLRLLA